VIGPSGPYPKWFNPKLAICGIIKIREKKVRLGVKEWKEELRVIKKI